MALGHDHRIFLGAYSAEHNPTVSEQAAVEIFRGVDPISIADTFEPLFESESTLVQNLDAVRASDRRIKGSNLTYRTNVTGEQGAGSRYLDVGVLFDVVRLLDGNRLVAGMPEPFQRIIGRQDEPSTLVYYDVGVQAGQGTQESLLVALEAAFTPQGGRLGLLRDVLDNTSFSVSQALQIIDYTPDLSHLQAPAERLDAVIQLLAPITHEVAKARHGQVLKEICARNGITSLDDLKASDPAGYRALHREAGAAVYAGSLFGVFTDVEHGGLASIFKVRPGEKEQTTERGLCPAAPLVERYQNAVCILLQRHYPMVLSLMERAR